MTDISKAAEKLHDEALQQFLSLLRIPSISSESKHKADILACKDAIKTLLEEKGFTVEELDTPAHPLLIGTAGPATGPELLFYAHYDVQPAKMEDGWTHDPFDPVIKDDTVYCRGSSDDKGQLVGLLYGILACREALGELPCRVRVLFEGAEEIGSPGLEEVLIANKEKIASDFVVVADCGRFIPERPMLVRSLRGLAYLEVFLQGTKEDLHSGSFGGTVDNPAQVLSNIISALKNEKRQIAVPGFYDDVVAPTEEELNELKDVPFSEEEYKKRLGTTSLAGEEGYSTLARRWLRPTLDINGITAGFQEEGAKTVLPAKASCKLSCRITPNQKPGTILGLIEDFIKELTPPTCRVSFKRYASADPVKLDLECKETKWVLDALRKAYNAEPMIVAEGATIPIVSTFANTLGIKPFPIGFARVDDNAHGPDETFAIGDLHKQIATIAHLLTEVTRSES